MSVRRMMGTETEYAVSTDDGRRYQPVELSFKVVGGAAGAGTSHIRWDYRQEDPLNDARGMRLPRASARPDMLTDEPQNRIVNVIAPNGGRVYVDHAHPEYSAPETMDPFSAVRYDFAGDRIMLQAARRVNAREGAHIVLHRNNVDGKGASWGTHENYTTLRAIDFERLADLMTLHFVARQIFTGSGRVGLGERGERPGFQLSQRADYVHARIGLQTTFDRPIVNARDESHVTGSWRRLHVIVGDANRMEVPQALKLGTTSMVLWLLEHAGEGGFDLDGLLHQLRLLDPVEAMHRVSHDLTLGAPLELEHGGTTTAWQIEVRLMTAVYTLAAALHDTDSKGEPLWPDEETRRTMAMWRQALADVAALRHAGDEERMAMREPAGRLEWLLKWQLMERLRRKANLGWDDPRLAALDLSWAALDPARSVFAKLESQTERLDGDEGDDDGDADDARIRRAMAEPPEDTRAWLRAELIRRFPDDVVAASWSHVTVRNDGGGDGIGDAGTVSDGQCDRHDAGHGDGARTDAAGCDAMASAKASDAEGNRIAPAGHGLISLDISEAAKWNKASCEQVLKDSERLGETAARTLARLARL
ncbi:depupylase/deamidase Dop [Bifidobacterium sp. ESL0763]|uniref:depupylase/deamidase Dop n=1 Tax=Bifidobacterium sp. ESL0763 TaxID=2983227 RepID=UPI0023F6BF11|nr:depupylase/deamidase Dop [Bifidobacterium sp. ESL0763]